MRATAQSLEEICARHGCARSIEHSPNNEYTYTESAIAIHSSISPLPETLSPALPKIRADYEIAEIYARPRGEFTVFEPLEARHFETEAEWVVVARRRTDAMPRVVGIMLAKDEADAIPDVVASLAPVLNALYYFAGDAATAEAIVASEPRSRWARPVAIPDVPHADGLRQFLLERARADKAAEGDLRPMWVVVAQGDEIYADDLARHIRLAQMERATVMTCQVATFVLHESQRGAWDWTLPLEERLTHYIWDFGEHSGFLDFPWIYYSPSEHMRAHPHGCYPAKYASARPVRKHYPFRSPEQAEARIKDRLRASPAHPHGWQPHYTNYQSVFVGDEVAGREVKRYHGWFGEAERTEGIW